MIGKILARAPIAPAVRMAVKSYFKDDEDAKTLAEFAIKALSDQGVRTLADVAKASEGRITEQRIVDMIDGKVWGALERSSEPLTELTESTIDDVVIL